MRASTDDWWASAALLLDAAVPSGPARTRRAGWQVVRGELIAANPFDVAGPAVARGFVLRRGGLGAYGVPDPVVRRLVRQGRWTAPRRGIVCPLPATGDERPGGDSAEIVITAAALARSGCGVTHESAACLYGLPVLDAPDRTQLTSSHGTGGSWADCAVHAAPLPAAELGSWFGTPVSSIARTIVDIARARGVAAGLVVADAALREDLISRAAITGSVAAARRRPGVTAAAQVARLADAGGHSPLESLVRLCLAEADLPTPQTQARVDTDRGSYFVDLLFGTQRVAVEADGQLKYRADRGGRADALWRENLRQEAIERAGYRVVRVTWSEVRERPAEVVARVRWALGHTPTTGRP